MSRKILKAGFLFFLFIIASYSIIESCGLDLLEHCLDPQYHLYLLRKVGLDIIVAAVALALLLTLIIDESREKTEDEEW